MKITHLGVKVDCIIAFFDYSNYLCCFLMMYTLNFIKALKQIFYNDHIHLNVHDI